MQSFIKEMDMRNKTALVTGAAGIMGSAVVKALLAQGLRVVMADLAGDKLKAMADGLGERAVPAVMDISDPGSVETEMSRQIDRWGGIDILVNNAGILSNNKTLTTPVEEWRRVMEINLNSMFYTSRAVVSGMKEKGWGRIVNVSSLAAKTGGITAGTAYSTSKGGVISLTYSLAAETAPFGITVNALAPAYVITRMIT